VAVSVVRAEKVLHRPPQTVFGFVATHHFENHPKWDPDVLEMRQTSLDDHPELLAQLLGSEPQS
jgi:hypothetical protein